MKIWWSETQQSIGTVGLASSERGLVALFLPSEREERDAVLRRLVGPHELVADGAHNADAARQVEEFLVGARTSFDLELDQRGSAFQRAVWDAVAAVPWGRTTTYGEVARQIGQPAAVRAVGAANGDNPLPLVVPCHRVVGTDGRLTGYGGGLPLKAELLAREGALPRTDEEWTGWARRLLEERPGALIGPRSTRIYCRPDCRYTARLGRERVPAIFDSAAEAVAEGYRACRVCRPD